VRVSGEARAVGWREGAVGRQKRETARGRRALVAGSRAPGRPDVTGPCGPDAASAANPCENRDAPVRRQANEPRMA
jgi:hypothetical protein